MIFENSKATVIIPLSIALGIMLSPESLVILGNGMGSGGFLFLAVLLLAMAVYFMTALSHDEVFALSPGWAGEARLMRQAFGWLPATVLVFCSRLLSGMARENLLPSFFAGSSDRSLPTLIILVLGIAVMLGLGMAGEPALGIYIRSALLFWLLFYSAVHLSLLKVRKNYLQIGRVSRFGWRPVVSTVSVLIMLVGFIGLLWTDPESVELVKFMLTIGVASSILGLFWLRLNRGGKAFVTGG